MGANLVANGDFEQPVVPSGKPGWIDYPGG